MPFKECTFLGLIYIFRLLYVIRCFRVTTCLGFKLVGNYIEGQSFPFSC